MSRKQWWGTAVVVVMLLGACSGRETVTGGYGSGVVTGQVSMAASLPGASPAGVRLSVAGTGISTLLGEDGRFALSGVPERAELRFTRDDGISTNVTVAANGPPVAIQLGSGSTHSGHGRAVTPVNPPWAEIEGTIKTPGTSSIVVSDSHKQDFTFNITAATIIRHGNTTIAAADLKAGDRVHVKVSWTNNIFTALQIEVQDTTDQPPGDDHGQGSVEMTANGTVTVAGASQITVSTVPKGEIVVKTDANTIIRKQGQIITLAAINVGDEVNTSGTRVDDHTELARQIEVRGVSGHH